jgi:hypothetical protein
MQKCSKDQAMVDFWELWAMKSGMLTSNHILLLNCAYHWLTTVLLAGYPTIRPVSFRPLSFRPDHFVPWSFCTRSFRPLVISSVVIIVGAYSA